jgi:polyisoprenoid-binding protein YceI
VFFHENWAAVLTRRVPFILLVTVQLLLLAATAHGQTSAVTLEFAPSNTSINFTLGDIIHTIHGSVRFKGGAVEFHPETSTLNGPLVADSTSAQSGNRNRDKKMHREILESARYPEIVFRPDRVQGNVARNGTSTVEVHGTFSLHGADHEITVPVRVQILPDHWVVDSHFTIPYVKWGLKNPSTFLWRVSETVGIDVHATGTNPFAAPGTY